MKKVHGDVAPTSDANDHVPRPKNTQPIECKHNYLTTGHGFQSRIVQPIEKTNKSLITTITLIVFKRCY